MTRDELGRIVKEQAALRRVAMLVVRGASPAEVFTALAGELGEIMAVEYTLICRFRPGNTLVIVSTWERPGSVEQTPPVGSRWSLEPDSAAGRVARTGQPSRIEYDGSETGVAYWAWSHGCRSGMGCPIMVEGRLWGAAVILSSLPQAWQHGIEDRLLGFLELVGAAIANAESRDELAASRARVVAAADATSRRIERDLHDGVQQRLITAGLRLRDAQDGVPPGSEELQGHLACAAECVTIALDELREISHGLHPSALARGGVGPALKALARRSVVPVELRVRTDMRLPEPVEAAVYYVVSETLTNAAKHAHASLVRVEVCVREAAVHVAVSDDGTGGAHFGGSGLIGLKDRVAALGGALDLVSPPGGGTSLLAEIPLDGDGTSSA